jgi:hypothetical protein
MRPTARSKYGVAAWPLLEVAYAWRGVTKCRCQKVLIEFGPWLANTLIMIRTICLLVALLSMVALDAQTAKQDVKDAGQDVKQSAKSTGDAAKKTGSAAKKSSKKAVHKSAKKVKQGATKVQDETK